MANTKITSRVLADDAVNISNINTVDGNGGASSPSADGQALVAKLTVGTADYYLDWADAGASSINDLSDAKTFGTGSIMIGDSTTGTINAADRNTGVGVDVFASLTEGDGNNVLGYQALDANTTGNNNVAIGESALGANTTASNNVAIGHEALLSNTTGGENTAIGYKALDAATTADNNVAIGYNTATNLTTGEYNTIVGTLCMKNGTTAYQNFIGGRAAWSSTFTGGNNVIIGFDAGKVMTVGGGNVIIGKDAGDDLTTGNHNTIIGHECKANGGGRAYSVVMGYFAEAQSNEAFLVGRGGTDSQIAFGATSITAPSDERLKEDVQDEQIGLDFINELRPVTFRWKKEKDVPTDMRAYKEGSEERVMNGKYNHGFIAQEVKQAIDNYDFKEGFDLWTEDDHEDGRQRLGESALISILVKAVQQADDKIDALEARIQELEG